MAATSQKAYNSQQLEKALERTFVERMLAVIDADLDAPATITGRCQIVDAESRHGFECAAKAPTFCRTCFREICAEHAYTCCMTTYGACCISQHECAIKTVTRMIAGKGNC